MSANITNKMLEKMSFGSCNFEPEEVANALILRPNMQRLHIPDNVRHKFTIKEQQQVEVITDVSANDLVFLKTLGYDRWQEISKLPQIINIDVSSMHAAKKSLLKELGVI